MPSRDINDLHPQLQPLAKEFIALCKKAGVELLITCTYRSNEEQNELYAAGRTKLNMDNLDNPYATVTKARGGESEHNFMLSGKPAAKAFDVVPLINGKAEWNTSHIAWAVIGNVWKKGIKNREYYLDWLGRQNSPYKDYPHFSLKSINHITKT